MVISHKYRYLFIEIPSTGSWAIRKELCENYAGTPILHKHATYPEFRQIATDDEKSYFVFATIRHPLDTRVSGYFKIKTNHKDAFSNPGSIESLEVDYVDLKRYERFKKNSNVTFEAGFLASKLWERPYSSMIELSGDRLDFVIRYENLQEGFAEALRRLGIKQVRAIPTSNKTQGRKSDWTSYYTPNMIEKAKRVYGPYMQKWGYEFPATWGDYQVSRVKQVEFRIVNLMKTIYLIHFRYNNKPYSKFVRKLRVYMDRIM